MHFNFDKNIQRQQTSCLKYDGMEQFLGVANVLPMWVADMDFATPAFITEAFAKRVQHGIFGYSFRGKEYYQPLVGWQLRRHQWAVEPAWVEFSPGVVPALNLAVMAFTEPGDKIIVQPPVYAPFFGAATDHECQLVFNPLVLKNGRLCMDLENLEKVAAEGAKMFILCSPHNPGGSVWTREELTGLAEICLKNNILILSDEIHCDLVYKPYKHIPIASLSPEISQITITTVAPSKTFNLSGLSTAAVIIENETLRKQFASMRDHVHVGVGNIFGDMGLQQAFCQGDAYVAALMDYLAENVEMISHYMQQHIPAIKVIKPEATFLLWLDCRELGLNDQDLNRFFLEKAKVGMNTGVWFGAGGEGFMRMNIGCPKATIQQALAQISEAVKSK